MASNNAADNCSSGDKPLCNCVAVVTGASSGIGEAIAMHFSRHGASLVLAARRKDKLNTICNQLRASGASVIAVPTDVVNIDNVKALVEEAVEQFGRIDVLVNCAGVMFYTMVKNVHLEEWNHMVDVNCKGVMNCTAAVLPGMLEQKSGHIVNISSDAGKAVFPGLCVYSATKFFVEAFTRGLRSETRDSGVKVTSIQPGDVRTAIAAQCTDAEAVKECAQQDKELFLEVDDVARAVVYAVTQPKDCAVNEILIEPRQCPT